MLSQRVRLTQAAATKRRLSEEISGFVEAHGRACPPSPGPPPSWAPARSRTYPAVKAERLRAAEAGPR